MAAEDSATPASTAMAAEDASTPASTAMAPENFATPASTVMAPEDGATPASTANIKPKRCTTRSLLGLDRETAVNEIIGDASVDLAATGSSFTRSLLKPKVEALPASSLVMPEEPVDSTLQTPPSATKMEMKMSKKVSCHSNRD